MLRLVRISPLLLILGCRSEEAGTCALHPDTDLDGYGDAAPATQVECGAPGFVSDGNDCDDADPSVHPAGNETCDGIDNNCDGLIDESGSDAPTWYLDADGDRHGDSASPIAACVMPEGCAPGPADCDDARADVNPDALELCDGVDNDCDRFIDDDDPDVSGGDPWYLDGDGDGHGTVEMILYTCEPLPGTSAISDDCDDDDPSVYPGAPETDCTDPVDHDCDGLVIWADEDGDGWAACVDCDDASASIHPGVLETCNDLDDNCDGNVDEGEVHTSSYWYPDRDGDGYGDPDDAMQACDRPKGYLDDGSDCDDGDASIHPDAPETDCTDPVDHDCDGYGGNADMDSDGFTGCDDCDESDATIHPSADELCNSVDDDCDGTVDEDPVDATTWYLDQDNDGYGLTSTEMDACTAPRQWSSLGGDCDDTDTLLSPGAAEACDGLDNNCDGVIDAGDFHGTGANVCASAILFESAQEVTVPNTTGDDLLNGFTLEAWIKVSPGASNPDALILSKHQCGGFNGWFIGLSGNVPSFYVDQDPRLVSTWAIDDDSWHFVAGSFDGSMAILYVDGVQVNSQAATYTSTNKSTWHLGDGCNWSGGISGTVDEVRIWSVGRSAGEIASDMYAILTGQETGLEAYYRMEEMSGQLVLDMSTAGRDAYMGMSSRSERADPTWVIDGPF